MKSITRDKCELNGESASMCQSDLSPYSNQSGKSSTDKMKIDTIGIETRTNWKDRNSSQKSNKTHTQKKRKRNKSPLNIHIIYDIYCDRCENKINNAKCLKLKMLLKFIRSKLATVEKMVEKCENNWREGGNSSTFLFNVKNLSPFFLFYSVFLRVTASINLAPSDKRISWPNDF